MLEVVYLSPEELTPYEGNARKHDIKDVEQIKESIRLDGFNDPIGIWGDNNIIVEGHGRQIAALEMGLDKVPCIRLDHLTDAQRSGTWLQVFVLRRRLLYKQRVFIFDCYKRKKT